MLPFERATVVHEQVVTGDVPMLQPKSELLKTMHVCAIESVGKTPVPYIRTFRHRSPEILYVTMYVIGRDGYWERD